MFLIDQQQASLLSCDVSTTPVSFSALEMKTWHGDTYSEVNIHPRVQWFTQSCVMDYTTKGESIKTQDKVIAMPRTNAADFF